LVSKVANRSNDEVATWEKRACIDPSRFHVFALVLKKFIIDYPQVGKFGAPRSSFGIESLQNRWDET